jgi:hypothetical protein
MLRHHEEQQSFPKGMQFDDEALEALDLEALEGEQFDALELDEVDEGFDDDVFELQAQSWHDRGGRPADWDE